MPKFMDYCLSHGWGHSPEQKEKERRYNEWYYQTHPEKWGMPKTGREGRITMNKILTGALDDSEYMTPRPRYTANVVEDVGSGGAKRFETVEEAAERELKQEMTQQKIEEGKSIFEEFMGNYNYARRFGGDAASALIGAGAKTLVDRWNRK